MVLDWNDSQYASLAEMANIVSPNWVKMEARKLISSAVLPSARQQARDETKNGKLQEFMIDHLKLEYEVQRENMRLPPHDLLIEKRQPRHEVWL